MLNSTPAQRKKLGKRIRDFLTFYAHPNHEDTPAGCKLIVTRAGIEQLMTGHGYQPGDLADPGKLDAFAEPRKAQPSIKRL
ncbi:hypothetical protein [Longispora albida]|uniref:hypothetical protein n=1 Tax=Longispora albida TaxID=203523 RepID=UPI00035DB053|nr:hypothetical protein [Longispora albida]